MDENKGSLPLRNCNVKDDRPKQILESILTVTLILGHIYTVEW